MSEAKNQPVDTKSELFDQFVLAEQVGIVNSNRLMKILRHSRKCGTIAEGILAGKCCERMCFPEWSQFINQLLAWEFIKVTPTGRGNYRNITLTEKGEEFLGYTIGPLKAQQPTVEVDHGTVNA